MSSVTYDSPCKAHDHGITVAIAVGFTESHLQDSKLQQFTSGFQELVRAYKNLPAPSTIDVDLESSLVIEVQEAPPPEIDLTSIRQYLRRTPRPQGKGKKIDIEKGEPTFLVLDFRYVTEMMPPASPRVSTTYSVRNRTAVSNEWHFMLTKCPAYGLGIFIYLPGTGLRYFIDMVIADDSRPLSPAEGASFQFPLDLIAWQLFDFFTHRIVGEKFNTEKGFAPSSLHCGDKTLGYLLSRLFFSLGLPKERNIEISNYKGIPEEYEEQLIGLPNRNPEWIPLRDFKTVLVCQDCHQFFICVNLGQDTCGSCNEESSSSKSRPGPVNGSDTVQSRMSLQCPPLYFAKKTNAQLDKRKNVSEGFEGRFGGKKLRKTTGASFPELGAGGAQCS